MIHKQRWEVQHCSLLTLMFTCVCMMCEPLIQIKYMTKYRICYNYIIDKLDNFFHQTHPLVKAAIF